MNFEIVQPDASAMAEALRAIGYSTPTAIADIIDNSISAGASRVHVRFHWSGDQSFIRISDNGCGMSEPELVNAMRPGSRNPLEERSGADLGRFGLGLKSASFSQCRRLTVSSRGESGVAACTRRWDLDYINETSEWRLLRGSHPGSENRLGTFEETSGTTVLWEVMDRIVDEAPVDNSGARDRFNQLARESETYLSMVFHRFLEARNGLNIMINDNEVTPWNPFLENHETTQWLGQEILPYRDDQVEIQPYVLPHRSRLDVEEHRRASGPGGWNARQGFYVYRNRRLLVAGDWLGLPFTKEEHYKLARIRVDISNTMDREWQIDVRKSRARPPGVLRRDLERIARLTRERAVSIYRHRGKVIARGTSGQDTFVWERVLKDQRITYRIDRGNPLVRKVLDGPQEYRKHFRALLKLIEETVPIEAISIDHSEQPDNQSSSFELTGRNETRAVLVALFQAMIGYGLDREEAAAKLIRMENFQEHQELIAAIVEHSEEIP